MIRVFFIFISLFIIHNIQAQEDKEVNKIFEKKFEYKMISKGDNFPDFYVRRDSADFFLFCLHQNISIDLFKKKTNFDDTKINKLTSFLTSKNWLHIVNGQYKSSIFIASVKDAETLYEHATPISENIASVIKDNLPKIKEMYSKTDISESYPFSELSFLILSDVLLDSWQIDNVERDFLKQTERPKRHGKHYYQTIMEKSNTGKESFGIYGNQMWNKNGKLLALYGYNQNNMTSDYFYKISKKDDTIFSEMASSFLPDLISVLEKHRAYSETVYRKLGYSDEITFAEFYIWWYHFIYTEATNILASDNILLVPECGNFYYEME